MEEVEQALTPIPRRTPARLYSSAAYVGSTWEPDAPIPLPRRAVQSLPTDLPEDAADWLRQAEKEATQ